MNLKRPALMFLALLSGQGVSIVSQLLLPPIFLHRYARGVATYGEWVALSAATAYLSNLNYGVQTYASNQMTILYGRGERDAARSLQASALLLLLALIGTILIAAAIVFVLPLGRWLNLTLTSDHAAAATLYLFVIQILISMPVSLLANGFMAVGRSHRGTHWINGQRLLMILIVAVLAWQRVSFPILALAQVGAVVSIGLALLLDIRRNAKELLPELRIGSWAQARALIRPSSHFGALAFAGFLVWQAPILMIQRYLGASAVVSFSISRTLFSMSRQMLALVSFSIGPEISVLAGKRDWHQLKKLYEASEKVVLLLVPTISVAVLLLAPVLIMVWLRRADIYQPATCLAMALISAIMGIKEHKYQFQTSSNEHETLARHTTASYLVMALAAIPSIKLFGMQGFMVAWLLTELYQTGIIFALNRSLLRESGTLSVAPLAKLVAVLSIVFSLATWPAFAAPGSSVASILTATVVLTTATIIASYYVFDVKQVTAALRARVTARMFLR